MTQIKTISLLVITLLLWVGVVRGDSGVNPEQYLKGDSDQYLRGNSEQYFNVNLPAGFRSEKTIGIDYDFYRVTDGQSYYVEIYVGEAPPDPPFDLDSSKRVITVEVPRMKLTSIWKGEVLDALDILIMRSDLGDFPNYIRAWTVQNAPNEQLAKQILLSLTVFDKCTERTFHGFC